MSLLTLVCKGQFNAFQDVDYPAHLTPLLETDLRRMSAESSLKNVTVEYSLAGRIIFTPWHYAGVVALILGFTPFTAQIGLQYWFLTGVLHAAAYGTGT